MREKILYNKAHGHTQMLGEDVTTEQEISRLMKLWTDAANGNYDGARQEFIKNYEDATRSLQKRKQSKERRDQEDIERYNQAEADIKGWEKGIATSTLSVEMLHMVTARLTTLTQRRDATATGSDLKTQETSLKAVKTLDQLRANRMASQRPQLPGQPRGMPGK